MPSPVAQGEFLIKSVAMEPREKKTRIRWLYLREVAVPPCWQKFLWDYPDKNVPLEKLLARVLEYGNFDDLSRLYWQYPEETVSTARRYSVRRGIRFWLDRWREGAA